jgi:hypothetical protein
MNVSMNEVLKKRNDLETVVRICDSLKRKEPVVIDLYGVASTYNKRAAAIVVALLLCVSQEDLRSLVKSTNAQTSSGFVEEMVRMRVKFQENIKNGEFPSETILILLKSKFSHEESVLKEFVRVTGLGLTVEQMNLRWDSAGNTVHNY